MFQLSEEQVREQIDPREAIHAIEAAFGEGFSAVENPPRAHLPIAGGVFLMMPCYDRRSGLLGIKLITVVDHPAEGQDRVQATYALFEGRTGRLSLIISARFLTDLRTAATSAVATKFLAREDAQVLGIFGTGRQARAHAGVLPLVRPFSRILVCGRTSDSGRAFADKISNESSVQVEATDAETCAAESDVICTCTTSEVPVLHGDLIRPGTHLNLVGTFQPHCREVDSAAVRRAQILVDTYDGALAEAGDLLVPIHEGAILRQHIVADLHELVSGKKMVRRSPDEITIFKSVGCALEDLAVAKLLRQAAE
jgi:alanine dehydrogenase